MNCEVKYWEWTMHRIGSNREVLWINEDIGQLCLRSQSVKYSTNIA